MKCLVQTSGGLDSAAALIWALRSDSFTDVVPVFYDYGQPYREREHDAAIQLVSYMRHRSPAGMTKCAPMHVHNLHTYVNTTSGTPKEYVPYRNLLLTAHSINMAAGMHLETVVVGSKSLKHRNGDAYSFKDSTLPFYRRLYDTIIEGSEPSVTPIQIAMPLAGWGKEHVVKYLIEHGYDADRLWTCYTNGPTACGKCYHCKEYATARSSPEVQQAMRRLMV